MAIEKVILERDHQECEPPQQGMEGTRFNADLGDAMHEENFDGSESLFAAHADVF